MDADAVRERYARFARDEAPSRSPLYAEWAQGVADDPDVAGVLARIPETHRQPPLVFAVSRMLGAPERAYPLWAAWVRTNGAALVAESSRRSIQTNEPLRCAALLPALARIDGPIALLEVGASAGLCLYPDRYSYRYETSAGERRLDPHDGPSAVVLHSRLEGDPPLRMPEIVWRAGIDLEPRDARDPGDRAWITGLVWPGESGRVERVSAALDIAAADPPVLVAGDGADALPALAARAPRGATLVVTTPGVLAHVPRARRAAVIAAARAAGTWITIDAPGLHDAWRALPDPWPGGFVLASDGVALAAVDPLGASVAWLPDDGRSRA
ncbi:DUF2332 domain-containing protein [Microbacterium sp. 10M-3C3]|jgi:hypothetical protein|uniref:DUF2332 domain-containing protein n=1 Tax=Microbacterium sp. 10M-3C3 TaxID=2483401 RepID=UPI000F64065D|nr:DUF2332 domain-containing protein [Microbacterium sp. 10M-3C3]